MELRLLQKLRKWLLARVLPTIPPLVWLAVAAVLGIACAHLATSLTLWFWISVTLSAAVVFVRHRGGHALAAFVGTSYGLLHFLNVSGVAQIPHWEAMLEGQRFPVTVTGIVDDAPNRLGNNAARFPLKLQTFRDTTRSIPCHVDVQVTLLETTSPPGYGDSVRVEGLITMPRPAANPGQFDARTWYLQQGISGDLLSSGNCVVLGRNRGNPLVAASLASREWIRRQLSVGLENDPDTASIINAMVLGTRNDSPDEIERAFIGSGTMHVFAVSGLHVGLFALMAWMFLKAVGVPRPVAVFLIIPGIIFYAFVTGLRPSACRATIMATILLAGYLFSRLPSLTNSLGAAALVILFTDTLQILQPGFQLSFLVLACIAIVGPLLRRPLQQLTQPDPFLPRVLLNYRQRVWHGGGKWGADLVSVSFAAWLGSAPLMMAHFEISTPIAILANCFLVPCAFAVLFTSSVSLILGSIAGSWISALCNNANWLLAKCSIGLASIFAGMPGGQLAPAGYGSVGTLQVTVLHVDRGGSCCHVSVKGGQSWLLDTGHEANLRSILLPYLKFRDALQIDAVLISHADSNHIGALRRVIEETAPSDFVESVHDYNSPAYRSITAVAPHKMPRIDSVSAGREFDLGQGTTLRILYPPEKTPLGSADDQAIVAQVEHHGWRLLFTQDAGLSTERWLLENCRYLDSDVLIKGRHLADFSGIPEFVDAVSPGAIISTNASFPAGERIPHQWRALVKDRGITLFDQESTGAVQITAAPNSLELRSFLGDTRRKFRR